MSTRAGTSSSFVFGLATLSLGALVLAASPASAAPSDFTFSIPDGWVDLSPGAPAENFAKAPPAIVEQAKSGRFVTFAGDLAHAEGGFITNMNVLVGKGSIRVTDEAIAKAIEEVTSAAAKSGGKAQVLEKAVVSLGGVHAGRWVTDFEMGDVHVRNLQYFVPGERSHAVLTYTTSPEAFATYLPVFERSAAGTRGAHEPKTAIDWSEVAWSGAVGGVVAGVVGAITRRRKKKETASAA